MAKTVFLLRHAEAEQHGPGRPDHDRPLSSGGLAAASAVGQWFFDQRIGLDSIVSSTAVRAASTARAVADHFPSIQVNYEKRLYLAPPDTHHDVLMDLSQSEHAILLVGHNPGLSELASRWAQSLIEMRTSAVLQFQFDLDDWIELSRATRAQMVQSFCP